MAIDIHWIRDNESLAQFCAEWQQLPFVAIDTEFMRVDTFYPIAGLLQVGDGKRAYLIDPLSINAWQPLAALLENPAVLKVLHACSEDLEVLLRLTGSLPAPMFDTQLAAAYLNLGFSMGYSRLVQSVLGIELPKGNPLRLVAASVVRHANQLRRRRCRASGGGFRTAAAETV